MSKEENIQTNSEGIQTLWDSGLEGRATVYLAWMAKRAKTQYRKNRDFSLIVKTIELWLGLCGLSRTEANGILATVKQNLSLRGSVI